MSATGFCRNEIISPALIPVPDPVVLSKGTDESTEERVKFPGSKGFLVWQDDGYWMMGTGCWVLDIRCWILGTGYWILDAGLRGVII